METVVYKNGIFSIDFPRRYGPGEGNCAEPNLDHIRLCFDTNSQRGLFGLYKPESEKLDYIYKFNNLQELIRYRRKLAEVRHTRKVKFMGSQEEVEAYLHWDEGPCYAIEKINSDEQSIGLRPEDLTNLVENLENLEIAVESENARKLKSNQF